MQNLKHYITINYLNIRGSLMDYKVFFTGAPIYDTNPEVLVVALEVNSDEDITAGAKFSKINKSSDEMEIYIKEK